MADQPLPPPSVPARPWWLGPGPIALAVGCAIACGVVVHQGLAAARQSEDSRARDQQMLRNASFCDVPTPPGGTTPPPAK